MPRLPDRTAPSNPNTNQSPAPAPAPASDLQAPVTHEQVLALARRYCNAPGRAITVSINRIPNDGYRTPNSGQTVLRSMWRGYVLDANASNAVLVIGAGGLTEQGARFQLFIDLAELIREREEEG